MIIIGIESSCDETAVAVVKDKRKYYRVWSQAKLMCIQNSVGSYPKLRVVFM